MMEKGPFNRQCCECGAYIDQSALSCPNCGEMQLLGVDAFTKLTNILSIQIKNDEDSVRTILRTGFSAVTTDPNNLLSQAPTSEGKTYPIVTILELFPRENVWFLGGLSPTALAHDHGDLVNSLTGEKLDPILYDLTNQMDEADKAQKREIKRQMKEILKNAAKRVNMDSKIIVFLDNPNQETLNRLRPILSHDTWEVPYKFTDRLARGLPMQTVHVKVSGWPAVLSAITKSRADKDTWDQMASRFLTISPRQDRTKYRAAIELISVKKGLPQPCLNKVLELDKFEWARNCIKKIWDKLQTLKEEAREETGTKTPNLFWFPFYNHIGENFPANVGRHMRDSQRFMTSLNMGAAINIFARPILEIDGYKSIIVTRQDYKRAVAEFFEGDREGTIFTGVAAHILKFFKDVVIPMWPYSYVLEAKKSSQTSIDGEDVEEGVHGIEMSQLVKKCPEVLGKHFSSDTLRKNYIPELEKVGLMDTIPHPYDKRKNLHIVLSEDLNPKNSGEMMISNDTDIFSPESLREALDGLKQIADVKSKFQIHNFDGNPLTINSLYNLHFSSAISQNDIIKSEGEIAEIIGDGGEIGKNPLNTGGDMP